MYSFVINSDLWNLPYFSQKHNSSVTQFRWNNILSHALKEPTDVVRKWSQKGIADSEIQSDFRKARDGPTVVLIVHEAGIFKRVLVLIIKGSSLFLL